MCTQFVLYTAIYTTNIPFYDGGSPVRAKPPNDCDIAVVPDEVLKRGFPSFDEALEVSDHPGK